MSKNEIHFGKEYEFITPEKDEEDDLLDEVNKGCIKKFFHTFKYRCVYDIKITNTTNNEKVILNISHYCLEFKTE